MSKEERDEIKKEAMEEYKKGNVPSLKEIFGDLENEQTG